MAQFREYRLCFGRKTHYQPANTMSTLPDIDFDTSLPVIEREQLDMLLMADEGEDATSLIREIYQIFRDESDEKLTQLDAICEAGALQQLRNLVHFIAGSAGNLGMARLNAFLRAIEEAVDKKTLIHCESLAECIRREYTKACEAFEQELLG